MKRMGRVLIPLGAVAALVALALVDRAFTQTGRQKSNEPVQSQAEQQNTEQSATSDKDVVIGHLQGRDRIVTISRGPKGPVYAIKNKDGKILAAKLNEKELQTKYPAIYNQVKYGLAGNDATLRKDIRNNGAAR